MNATNVFLSFLVFSICTNSFFFAAAQEHDAVIDSDGDEVQAGSEYYVVPAVKNGTFGGLRYVSFGPDNCNYSVAETTFGYDGFPLTFTAYDNDSVIRLSTDLNFKFAPIITTCQDTFVWRVSYDESVEKYIIDVNGVEGNPGINTIDSWFKISKYGNNYKLLYWPTVCDICHFDRKDIGIFYQLDIDNNPHERLFLNGDEPFEVYFKKASGSIASF